MFYKQEKAVKMEMEYKISKGSVTFVIYNYLYLGEKYENTDNRIKQKDKKKILIFT